MAATHQERLVPIRSGCALPDRRPAGRVASRFAAALVAVAVALGLGTPGAPGTMAPAHAGSNARAVDASFGQQVLHHTNLEREKRGLSPLTGRACPKRFAARHVRSLAERDAFHHQKLRPVLRQCKLRTVGENLAWRRPTLTPEQVVAQWMASPPHRANILAPKFKYLGTGAFKSQRSGRVYVGQVFGG